MTETPRDPAPVTAVAQPAGNGAGAGGRLRPAGGGRADHGQFAALLFVSIVGLFYIKSANFTPWNVSGQRAVSAIGAGMAIALFSYLGVEVASVAAGKVRDPDRNVPRSTVLGTLACAVVYLLSLVAVFGIVPNGTLQKSTAPFSTAVNEMFGGTWAGYIMAIVVIISGFGH